MKVSDSESKELRSELKLLRRQNSKLKHKEEELIQQAGFVRNNPAPVLQTRYDGTILNVNPVGIKIFGKRVVGISVFSVLTNLKKSHLKKITGSKSFQMDISVESKEFQFSIRKDTRTKSFYFFGSDITERKLAEKNLRESEERLKLSIKGGDLGLFDYNVVTGECHFDKGWLDMLGYEAADIEPNVTGWVKLLHPDDEPSVMKKLTEHFSDPNVLYEVEMRLKAKSGEYRWILGKGEVQVRDDDGKPLRMSGTHQDITERKHTGDALKESEEKYRTLVEDSPLLICKLDTKGIFTYLNRAWEKTVGYTNDEMIGHSFTEFKKPEEATRTYNTSRKVVKGASLRDYETTYIAKNGSEILLNFRAGPTYDLARNVIGMQAMAEDITERKQAEEELKEANLSLQANIDQMPIGYIITGTDFVIQKWNPAAEKIFGFSGEEAIEQDIFDLIVPKDLKGIVKDSILLLLSDEPASYSETDNNIRKDGQLISCLWFNTPIKGKDDKVIAIQYMAMDITERKQLEKQLQESQRLEVVGQLAGGVAHDFNNTLAAIVGYAELSLEGVEKDSQVMKDLQALIDRANKSATIVDKLLAFSRKQVVSVRPTDLNQIIKETLKFIKPLIGEDIKLVRKLDHGIPEIQADPTAVDQIITNLCINARDAMQGGGKLTISTKLVTVDEEYCKSHVEASIGSYVILSVSDDGSGMDEETRDRIYDPFFSTKEVGKGSGLGLSMIYGLMKQHAGFVECNTELGKGTEFKIYFTLRRSSIKKVEIELDEELIVLGGNETILLVEDDEDVLQIEKRGLERRGYTVLTAENGRAALRLYKKNRKKIDIIITDIVLPLMSGIDFYESVRKIDPKTRFLFISGYADDLLQQKFSIEKDIQILKKPFKNQNMVLKVREILDG